MPQEYKKFEDNQLPDFDGNKIRTAYRLDCMKENYEICEPVRAIDKDSMEYIQDKMIEMWKLNIPFVVTRESFENGAMLYRFYVAGVEAEVEEVDGE